METCLPLPLQLMMQEKFELCIRSSGEAVEVRDDTMTESELLSNNDHEGQDSQEVGNDRNANEAVMEGQEEEEKEEQEEVLVKRGESEQIVEKVDQA